MIIEMEIDAPTARNIQKADLAPVLLQYVQLAAYCEIWSAVIINGVGCCFDLADMDQDQKAVERAVEATAVILRRLGYKVTVTGTCMDIHWGE